MERRLETVLTEVVSHGYLWLETIVEKWEKEGVPDYGDPRVIRLADDYETVVGHKDRPTGWRELLDLAFRFDDDLAGSARGFYTAQGPLGDPQWEAMLPGLRERLGWARAAVDWFRELTALVDALRDERLGPLWARFGEPRELGMGEKTSPLYFVGPHPQGGVSSFDYSIRWVPRLGYGPDDDDDERCLTPQDESELKAAAWGAVLEAIEYELSRIPLVLMRQDVSRPREPQLVWGFSAAGAFHEGFLDWFFRIFVPLRVTTCRARGCTNPVLPPNTVYCSRKCRNRQKQQDYRDRL